MLKLVLTVTLFLLGSKTMAEKKDAFVLLDVRTAEEYKETHVVGSQNIDWNEAGFKDRIASFDKDASYKLYCRSGNRSGKATELMKTMGFKNVENLGSVGDASTKLKLRCEGLKPC